MLTFERAFRSRLTKSGTLVVVFFVTFQPSAQRFGIPGVISAAEYLADLVRNVAPPGALVGDLSGLTMAVFLASSCDVDVSSFVASLLDASVQQDAEIEPGEWAEIRVAVGVVHVTGDDSDPRAIIEEAARRAEADQARFPKEWRYPVLVADE